jgi:hypothetical protein
MEFQARKKPECYSPGRTKSFQEIAENDCFTCPERVTCLEFVAEVRGMATTGVSTGRQPPPLPTTDQIIALAVSTDLVYENSYSGVFSPYTEGTDIRGIVVDFATKLLQTYGNPS